MTHQDAAKRIAQNLEAAGMDPSGSCFLAARAMNILLDEGESDLASPRLIQCRLWLEWHVIYQGSDGMYTDLTAHGLGEEPLIAASELPEGYTDLVGYEWPEQYSVEFESELSALTA